MDSPTMTTSTRNTSQRDSFDMNMGEDASALPKSELDALSELEITQVQTDLSNELFGFSPISFTSRVVDVANEVIYDVIDKIELECLRRWVGEKGVVVNEDRKQAVLKGVNRLETLLMAAVDLRFDQAEVWLLRNTFKVPRELIPYILLPHHPQEGFLPYSSIKNASSSSSQTEDDVLMKELETRIIKVNEQREEIAILDLVLEKQNRRLKALKQIKSNLSQLTSSGGARDQLSSTSKTLASSIPSIVLDCQRLLASFNNANAQDNTASSTTTTGSDAASTSTYLWGKTREDYIAWRAEASIKLDDLAASSASQTTTTRPIESNDDMRGVTKRLAAQGNAKDAAALKQLLDG